MTVSKCGNHKCRRAWETVTSETLAPTVETEAKQIGKGFFKSALKQYVVLSSWHIRQTYINFKLASKNKNNKIIFWLLTNVPRNIVFQRGLHSQGLCTPMCERTSINWKVTLFYTSGFPMNFFLSDKTVSGKPRRDTIWNAPNRDKYNTESGKFIKFEKLFHY